MKITKNGDEPQPVIITRSIPAKTFNILFGLLVLFSITIIALVAAALGVVIHRLSSANTTNSLDNIGPLSFADQIKIDDLMKHLEQLQVIADQSNGTRAIGTRGFNGTLDYITNQLQQNTNFIIQHEYFTLPNYIVRGTPELQSQINGVVINHVYLIDFTRILFSAGANFDSFVQLVSIENLGCQDSDWMNVPTADSIAVVKRGNCTFAEKCALAAKYGVKGLLIYNDGTAPDRFQSIQNAQTDSNTTIPAYFLSYNLGMTFVNATSNENVNIGIIMKIDVSDAEGIGNICADTPTGDRTKTIVVGSHSDGVPAGSGINDNGKKNADTPMDDSHLIIIHHEC
jgi:Zn-dependent M28 family amino/carboxypeptidase